MTQTKHRALIVEDDPAIRRVLRLLFEEHGFHIVLAETALGGAHSAKLNRPDIVIVDLGLPDRDGRSVIKGLRAWSSVPILVLSARAEERELVAALDAGADDYLLKPFSPVELMARVRALLRRHVRGRSPEGLLRLGDVVIDTGRRLVRNSSGRELKLTPLEHRILATLARHREAIVTHSTLLKEVWGPAHQDTRALRVYIGSLRRKLERDPTRPEFILTELGVGYRLATDSV